VACHGIVRVRVGWQRWEERATAGVPWRFGVLVGWQRVAGASATGREGDGSVVGAFLGRRQCRGCDRRAVAGLRRSSLLGGPAAQSGGPSRAVVGRGYTATEGEIVVVVRGNRWPRALTRFPLKCIAGRREGRRQRAMVATAGVPWLRE